jgi:hypothetical protein
MNRNSLRVGLAVTATMVALMAPPAQATPPGHFSEAVDLTYQEDYLTGFCGFPVFHSLVGTLKSTLHYDRSGAIVSETDTQPGATETFFAPTTGKSFSFPFASILRTDYTNGAALGSQAIATGSGMSLNVPGISAHAGRVVFSAIVFDHTSYGVPIVAFTGVISWVGHENDPDTVDAAFCSALAP